MFVQADFYNLRDGGAWPWEATAGKGKGKAVKVDAVFCSPPWGGPGYQMHKVFNLEESNLGGATLQEIVNVCKSILDHESWEGARRGKEATSNMAFFLPRTSDLSQLAKYVEGSRKAQAVHYCTGRRSKALCAYFGELANGEGVASGGKVFSGRVGKGPRVGRGGRRNRY